jgi:S-adenosylmethionine hydrolase
VTRPISFLSDFGLADEFVGVVHAVFTRIAPDSRIIDVSHQIPRGDIQAGALTLVRAVQYLPEGVAMAVVDPGVGTTRRAIVVATAWGEFVGPDNGILAPAVAMMGGAERIVAIEDPQYQLPRDGVTFDGRDVFAPAAALLAAAEIEMGDLGPEIDTGAATPLLLPLVDYADGRLAGQVLWIDAFGNCQTNITPDDMAELGLSTGTSAEVVIGATVYNLDWVASYGEAEPGEALIHVDSYGQIALAVREGRADDELALGVGASVVVRPPK